MERILVIGDSKLLRISNSRTCDKINLKSIPSPMIVFEQLGLRLKDINETFMSNKLCVCCIPRGIVLGIGTWLHGDHEHSPGVRTNLMKTCLKPAPAILNQ